MANKLYRLLDSVWNTPHLVTETALQPIVSYLQERSFGVPELIAESEAQLSEDDEPKAFNGIGEIKIDGVLTYKPVYGMCGPVGVSYQGIISEAAELIAAGAHTIIMTHSSPGGQAAHCFTTARELRDMCDESGVRLISYIDVQSCSAALALGVVADEVIIHPSAVTGSIGCVCALMDRSKALDKAGLKPVYIASTPGKTGMNADGSFSDDFLAEVQASVRKLGNEFANHVAEFTGIPVDDISAMDAKTYDAEEALSKGLVNSVMNHRQFADYLSKGKGI